MRLALVTSVVACASLNAALSSVDLGIASSSVAASTAAGANIVLVFCIVTGGAVAAGVCASALRPHAAAPELGHHKSGDAVAAAAGAEPEAAVLSSSADHDAVSAEPADTAVCVSSPHGRVSPDETLADPTPLPAQPALPIAPPATPPRQQTPPVTPLRPKSDAGASPREDLPAPPARWVGLDRLRRPPPTLVEVDGALLLPAPASARAPLLLPPLRPRDNTALEQAESVSSEPPVTQAAPLASSRGVRSRATTGAPAPAWRHESITIGTTTRERAATVAPAKVALSPTTSLVTPAIAAARVPSTSAPDRFAYAGALTSSRSPLHPSSPVSVRRPDARRTPGELAAAATAEFLAGAVVRSSPVRAAASPHGGSPGWSDEATGQGDRWFVRSARAVGILAQSPAEGVTVAPAALSPERLPRILEEDATVATARRMGALSGSSDVQTATDAVAAVAEAPSDVSRAVATGSSRQAIATTEDTRSAPVRPSSPSHPLAPVGEPTRVDIHDGHGAASVIHDDVAAPPPATARVMPPTEPLFFRSARLPRTPTPKGDDDDAALASPTTALSPVRPPPVETESQIAIGGGGSDADDAPAGAGGGDWAQTPRLRALASLPILRRTISSGLGVRAASRGGLRSQQGLMGDTTPAGLGDLDAEATESPLAGAGGSTARALASRQLLRRGMRHAASASALPLQSSLLELAAARSTESPARLSTPSAQPAADVQPPGAVASPGVPAELPRQPLRPLSRARGGGVPPSATSFIGRGVPMATGDATLVGDVVGLSVNGPPPSPSRAYGVPLLPLSRGGPLRAAAASAGASDSAPERPGAASLNNAYVSSASGRSSASGVALEATATAAVAGGRDVLRPTTQPLPRPSALLELPVHDPGPVVLLSPLSEGTPPHGSGGATPSLAVPTSPLTAGSPALSSGKRAATAKRTPSESADGRSSGLASRGGDRRPILPPPGPGVAGAPPALELEASVPPSPDFRPQPPPHRSSVTSLALDSD